MDAAKRQMIQTKTDAARYCAEHGLDTTRTNPTEAFILHNREKLVRWLEEEFVRMPYEAAAVLFPKWCKHNLGVGVSLTTLRRYADKHGFYPRRKRPHTRKRTTKRKQPNGALHTAPRGNIGPLELMQVVNHCNALSEEARARIIQYILSNMN